MSTEHVIPRALASIEEANPFLLRSVCRKCNNACGRHVDAPFLRSWTVQANIEHIKAKFSTSSVTDTLPPLFLGELHAVRHETRICDVWLASGGDRIYHFHEPYDQDPNARVAVGLPQWGPSEHFDPGFVFLVAVSDQEARLHELFNASFAAFPDSVFYLLNGPTPTGQNLQGKHFSDVPAGLQFILHTLVAMDGKTHGMRMHVYLDIPDRFMCKLALGFGSLFLAPDFQDSADANLLRDGLWTKDASAREKIPIRGRKFLGDSDPFGRISTYDDCHLLAAVPSGDCLSLILRLSGGESHCMAVSCHPKHWDKILPDQGAIWVIAPGVRSCVGPVALPDYIADYMLRRGGDGAREPRLVDLEAKLAKFPARTPIK